MDPRIESYINEVLENLIAEDSMKRRIAKDLSAHISDACQRDSITAVLERMGNPREVAREFMDTIYEDKDAVIEKLIQEKMKYAAVIQRHFEYKSKTRIWGLPLVHINVGGGSYGFPGKPRFARGIIAIGDVAIGVLSLGAISLGGISLGAISLGALALGGMALGGIAVGGLAVGAFALGGCAVGLAAIGGAAFGKVAVGGYANGVVAIGDKVVGDYTLIREVGTTSREEVGALIRTAYPKIGDWIVKVITFFTLSK
jgi:hypothetical protein